MALQAVDKSTLQIAKSSTTTSTTRPVKAILDEETYIEGISKIIERDFFPDLPKLRAQSDYLEAVQKNDVEKLRAIHIKYGSRQRNPETPDIYMTPATFETPDATSKSAEPVEAQRQQRKNASDSATNATESQLSQQSTGASKAATVSLDRFLHKNTSEDNDSFGDIMETSENNRKRRFAWLYEKEGVQDEELAKALALPSIEEQAMKALEGNPSKLQTWQYKPDNALMYVPQGVELSAEELVEAASKKPREILHANTRYQVNPFNAVKSRESIAAGAQIKAMSMHGKIGPDGKEIVPDTPKVGGYGFVATPSPAPGAGGESPLMTWGEIEGTPFRLDASDTPFNPAVGPMFKIPDVPKRDRIALELAEKASKQHRDKKQKALDEVTARLTSPGTSSRLDRLASLSPAARRLASGGSSGGSSRLGIRTHTEDRALRASYTPSPAATPPSAHTPGSAAVKTPSTGLPTPGSSAADGSGSSRCGQGDGAEPRSDRASSRRRRQQQAAGSAAADESSQTSLTDNLLNLPRRPQAHEFF